MHGDIVTDYYVFEDLIVTTSYNGSIRFWDAEGSEYTLLRMNLGIYISTLDFVPGIFALKSEKDVVLLRPFENNNAILLEGHSELYIEYMIYLEDSRHLVSCSDFGEIILWDLEKKEAIKTIHTQERIKSIYSVDHGRRIMVFSDDSTISVYDSATLSLIRTATFVEVYKHVLSPDHSLCYLMGWEEDRIIDTSNLETVMAVTGTIGSEVVFLNDNSRAILKNNNGLSILDIPGKAITKEREIEAYELTGFRLSHDSNTLACISDDHSIKLFDANSLEERLNIDCPGPSPEAVFFDPSDKTLFISFSDQSIGRYSAVDGTLIGMLEKKVEVLTDLLFSQERNIYITKGLTEAYIWNSDTHKPIGHIPILRTADLKSGYLFTAYFEKLYALPLYDTQMLLDEAERQLQGRTLTPEEKKRLFIVE